MIGNSGVAARIQEFPPNAFFPHYHDTDSLNITSEVIIYYLNERKCLV